MLKVALPLAALLAACAPGPPPPSMEEAQEAEVTSTTDFNWFISESQDVISLAYTVPETDNQALELECVRGSGLVKVSALAASTAPRLIVLRAGPTEVSLKTGTEPDVTTDDAVFLTAELPASSPVLRAFKASGRIDLTAGDLGGPLSAKRDAPRRIAAFFDRCGTGLRGRVN